MNMHAKDASCEVAQTSILDGLRNRVEAITNRLHAAAEEMESRNDRIFGTIPRVVDAPTTLPPVGPGNQLAAIDCQFDHLAWALERLTCEVDRQRLLS